VQKPRTGQNRGGTADGGGGRGSGEFDGGGGVVPAACLGDGKGPAPTASDRERREKRGTREGGFTGRGEKAGSQGIGFIFGLIYLFHSLVLLYFLSIFG